MTQITINPHATCGESRQSGFSMMELVLYIAVVAIAIIAVLAIFTNTFASSKVQNESSYVQSLVSEVQGMYGTKRDYGTGDLTDTLIQTKAAPAPMIVGNTLRNSWGGNVTVTGANESFAITTTAVPAKECIKLAQIGISPSKVSINSADLKLPLQTAAVVSACSGATNTITWNVR